MASRTSVPRSAASAEVVKATKVKATTTNSDGLILFTASSSKSEISTHSRGAEAGQGAGGERLTRVRLVL